MLTEEQIRYLLRFRNGDSYCFFQDDHADSIMHFLIDTGYIAARLDVGKGDDWFELTQLGEQAVHEDADRRSQRTKEERLQAKRWRFDLFSALLGSIVTALLQYLLTKFL